MPGVSCQNCINISTVDDIEPACIDGTGCKIKWERLGDELKIILNLRNKLYRLGRLGLAQQLIKTYNITEQQIELLAHIEMVLDEIEGEKRPK